MGFIHGCKASFPGILKLNGAWTFVVWVSLIVCINHYCPMPGYRLQLSHKLQLNRAAPPCPGLSFFHSLNIPWLSTKQQFVGINKGFKVTEKCVCVCVCVWDVCVCVIACVCVSEGLCILCVCVCVCVWVCGTVSGFVCVLVSLSLRVWMWIWHKVFNKLRRMQVKGVSALWWEGSNWLEAQN
jgi:hypothetical protein